MSALIIARQLSRKNNFSVCTARYQYQSTKAISTGYFGRYLNRTLFGVIVGAFTYDGYNEFEVYGGISRFLRSLKIAALISIDYSWNLRGINEGTDEYNRV